VDFDDHLRALIARRLERGDRSVAARIASTAWASLSSRGVARPLALPSSARVIGVGSAVLGGAGKTPLAVALARQFSRRGAHVAIVGHAYRASRPPPRGHVVEPQDPVTMVGDDALAAARLLAGSRARVIVAARRAVAVAHAASIGAEVILLDGVLQTSPRRLDEAILVLDAAYLWGSGACPPAGDLRAPKAALLSAADHIAIVTPGPRGTPVEPSALPDGAPEGAVAVPSATGFVTNLKGERRSLASLAGLRLGLLVAIARPERVVAALDRAGVRLCAIIALADHASLSPEATASAARLDVDAWLTTERCAVKLPENLGGREVLALEHRLDVEALVERFGQGIGLQRR
jgi:tetraacyldisaccharide 4'-kinase